MEPLTTMRTTLPIAAAVLGSGTALAQAPAAWPDEAAKLVVAPIREAGIKVD